MTDDDLFLDSGASDANQTGVLSVNGVQIASGQLDSLFKYTLTWQSQSGPETTVVYESFVNGSPIAIVDGPIPPEGTTVSTTIDFTAYSTAYVDLLCFTRGTMILTERGEVAIEDLAPGDTVLTRDNGAQPIRWIASRSIRAAGDMAPIRISKGAIGNDRDLTLSPAHRVLLSGWRAQAICGAPEALATARQLLTHDGVTRIEGGTVEYFHMLLDRHEIVTANGTPAETLNPSDMALDALGSEQRREIETLFPELLTGAGFPLARPMLSDTDVAALSG
ncbi:Hint domain-containing protein [Halovulum sp. GXIMD14794]